jgi:hypothetical protein
MPTTPEQYVSLSRYDFLVVFIGILVGLSVGKLVSFVGQLVSSKQLKRLSFTHSTYLLLMFLLQVHYWWKLWDAKAIGTVSFLTFLQLLILPMLMYFATAILCPEPTPDQPGFLEDYFTKRAGAFYSAVMAILVIGALQGIFLWHQPYQASVLRGVAALLVLMGIFISAKPFQLLLAVFLTVLFFIYVIGSGHFSHPAMP